MEYTVRPPLSLSMYVRKPPFKREAKNNQNSLRLSSSVPFISS